MAIRGTLTILAAALAACTPAPEPGSSRSVATVWLVDDNGDRFDITHAVQHYGLEREWFDYGIGKHAIPPLNHPPILEPGDPRYPSSGMGSMEAIGARLQGEARSYRVRDLVAHEIVNDTIGHTQAAVAY